MKARFILPVLALLVGTLPAPAAAPATRPARARVIFDSDMDSDCDDAGALAVLHALADLGEVTILATVTSSTNPHSAACIDAINTYYGRGDLPLGGPKGARAVGRASKYARGVAERFPNDGPVGKDVADALEVYRQVLERAEDGSVTIVTVGYLTNVAELLKVPAEGGRPSGLELARRKVKLWACMGGNFVGRPAHDDVKLTNNNFTVDKAAAHHAVHHWPGPLTFVGREIGSVPSGLKVGAKLARAPAENPVRAAYELYFGGVAKDRHVADPTTVLFAVRGLRDYWDVETTGYMDLRPDMTFDWRYERDSEQAYLLKRRPGGKSNDREVERVIEELMLRGPRHSTSTAPASGALPLNAPGSQPGSGLPAR